LSVGNTGIDFGVFSLQIGATTTIGAVIRGASGQTANLQEWQTSTGTVVVSVPASGIIAAQGMTVNTNGAYLGRYFQIPAATGAYIDLSAVTGSLSVIGRTTTAATLIVQGAASQTANLQEWKNSAGTILVDITAEGVLDAPLVQNAQTGTTYTTVLADAGKLVELNNASAITLTVPTNASVAYAVGTQINLLQTGAGQVTVAGTSGVTVNATPGLKLRAQWSSATLIKRATDTWVLVGDLSA
jgi:hypothetical protein